MALRYKNVHFLWLAAFVILGDQVTKQLVVQKIARFESIEVLPNFNIVHMHNTGAAFSMLSTLPPVAFVLLGVVVSIVILVWLRKNASGQRLVASGLSLILGGALGNVIDRVRLGHVTDFIDFHVGDWHFAAFNVADSAISVGAGLLILDMILDAWRRKAVAA